MHVYFISGSVINILLKSMKMQDGGKYVQKWTTWDNNSSWEHLNSVSTHLKEYKKLSRNKNRIGAQEPPPSDSD